MFKNTVSLKIGGHLLGVFGSPGPDTLYGGSGGDTLNGYGGADILNGLEGNDALFGGADNDSLTVDAGTDMADGGDGDDRFFMGTQGGNHVLHGGGGSDLMSLIAPEAGRIVMRGDLATGQTLTADGVLLAQMDGIEQVLVTSGRGNDILRGGVGNDSFDAWVGGDVISAGDGDDRIKFTLSRTDRADGGAGNDVFVVEYGNNKGLVGQGFALVDGGAGEDDLQLGGTFLPIVFDGTAQFLDGGKVADYSGFEAMSLLGSVADDSVTGLSGNDSLIGNQGNDGLLGMAGDDTLDGGAGNDLLDGGEGNDRLISVGYQGFEADTLRGGAGDDVFHVALVGLPDIISGGDGTDFLELSLGGALLSQPLIVTGDLQSGATVTLGGVVVAQLDGFESLSITGFVDNDSLIGSVGNDTLNAGAGADTVMAGDGDDLASKYITEGLPFTFDLGAGIDTILLSSFVTGNSSMILSASMQVKVRGEVQGVVTGAEIAYFEGGSGGDFLMGGAYGDTLIDARGGADTLRGLGGDDHFTVIPLTTVSTLVTGDKGIDTLQYLADTMTAPKAGLSMSLGADGEVLIASAGATMLTARSVELFEILGTGFADVIMGLDGADNLSGSYGNDTIYGGAGNDLITSGYGHDLVTGGDGVDAFRFWVRGPDLMTTVTDFSAEDRVYIPLFSRQPTILIGSDPVPTGRPGGVVMYDTDTGVLSIDSDGPGSRYRPMVLATLMNDGEVATLTADQFDF